MWRLIKNEISYFSNIFLVIAAILATFTIFTNIDYQPFKSNSFWNKYFWAALIGTGSYLLVYLIWNQRVKEKRDRFHALLPMSVKYIARARIIFGLFPVICVAGYLFLIEITAFNDPKGDAARSFAQLGLSFIFLVIILILFDVRFIFTRKNENSNAFRMLVIGLILAAISFTAVFLIGIPVYNLIYHEGEEVIFYLWGLTLSVISTIIFMKRKSFTS